MATVEEVLAKAAAWENAGQPDKAAKLRAYAETLQPAAPKATHTRSEVEAKAAEWEAAGQPEKAAKLRGYAATLPVATKKTPTAEEEAAGIAQPPPRDAETTEAKDARLVAMFETHNPALKGRYKTAAELPKVGTAVMGAGGGGKSGGARHTVQPWQNVKDGTFGDTAASMVEGPLAAAGQFGAGIMDSSQSPSREFLANDPLTKHLPSVILTGLGKIGDVGGAGLSVVGAGISGATGLAAELVPGQGAADEKKLAEELTGMAMFAVPELAGASSVPARVAAAAPKAAPVARIAPKVVDDAAAAERLGIPVMRSDVRPPQTALGKIAQRTGEGIPIAGTGGLRAKQFAARADAVKDFIQTYVGDTVLAAVDTVADSVRRVHGATVEKFAAQKNAVIKGASTGKVPVARAVMAIDAQIAKLKAAKNEGFAPIITELENFKRSITDQALPEIDMNRAYIGKVFKGLDADKIRDAGEKALSAIYGPLKADMAEFIRSVSGDGAVKKWMEANEKLSELATSVEKTALRDVLKKGEATPEVVRKLLFSQRPSDLKLLYRSLDEDGRKAARTSIVQEAMAKSGGAENLSVDLFKNNMKRLANQFGEFFKGEDKDAAQGLVRALELTQQASRAGAAPLTGVQNMPAILMMLVGQYTHGSMLGTGAVLGTIGGLARVYESVGVQSALRRLAKVKTPSAERYWLQRLDGALRETGLPVAAQQQSAMPMASGQN